MSRNCITEECWPQQATVSQFVEEIDAALPVFVENMRKLKNIPVKQYMEDWMETFTAWMELHLPDDQS